MALNFPNNPETNDTYVSGDTTWQWNGVVWNIVTSASQASVPNTFNTISVEGQNDLVADQTNDTLNIAAGSNIVITTDSDTDTVTIGSSVSGGGDSVEQNLWASVTADSGSTTANTATDTLAIEGGSNIATVISGDTLTISYTGSAGISAFTELSESTTSGLTFDEIFLPAITMLEVTNNGASAYRFDQYGTTDNPTIYGISGTTIAFKLNITGHPFLIQDSTGTNYNIGLIHVATNGTISTGADAQGQTSGTLYWKIPIGTTSPPNYRYQCSVHAGMVGPIVLKSFASI